MSGEKKNMTVNKMLTLENKQLKKSLREVQNALEELREKNHTLDKENGILGYRLTTSFVPEMLKFLASSVGAGFAISFYFDGKVTEAIVALVISIVIYGGILLIYRS